MALHDYVIDNSTGANVRADINSVLQAILTNNSSGSAPSTTAAYMWWADTTTGTLKIRNSANNGWVELLQLDGTLTLEDGSASSPALGFRDDLNTGIYSSAADTFNVATGGVERFELSGTATVFNEDGADVDFRIESDANPNMFKLDAGNSRVGIGLSTPTSILHIKPNVAGGDCQVHIEAESGNDAILLLDSSTGGGANADVRFAADGTTKGRISFFNASSAGDMAFAVGSNSEAMRIDSSGRLLIGHSSNFSGFALQVLGSDENTSSLSLSRFKANSSSSVLEFHKSRNNSVGSNTLVQNNDAVGVIRFKAADGTDFSQVADIQAAIDGTPGDNDTPGRLVFSTTADGSQFTTERMRIDSLGQVGIGVTPADLLHLKFGTNLHMRFHDDVDSLPTISSQQDANAYNGFGLKVDNLRIQTGTTPAERIRVAASGSIMIHQNTSEVPGLNNTVVGASFEKVGTQGSALFVSRGDSISLFLNRNNTGEIVNFNSSGSKVGSISTNGSSLPSDRNFKKNITDLTLGLDFVNTLKPSKFNLKLEEDTDPLLFGLIAQDVEESLTAAGVTKNSTVLCQHKPIESETESDYNLDYGKFTPILINAVKELSAKITTLETKVAALEAA